MRHVVIVESPAKCKTIGKYLGKDYTVLASFGHIRDLPSKDGSVKPEEDFAMEYEISADSRKHVKAIADAMKGADSLILATDPDREGEAISWHVLEALKARKLVKKDTQVQRVAFNSITKKAVTEALESPRALDMDLVNAQQARRALDYLVGFNLSPVLWRKLPGSRSAGRVQSVALRIICDREAEIEAFTSEEYWSLQGQFATAKKEAFTARLTHVDGDKLDKLDIKDEKSAMALVERLKKVGAYRVSKVEKKQVKRNPYAPFTTSTLQQEAARKLGFGAKRTMQTAQKLYEGIDIGGETTGLITYMRTDGVDVAPEAIHKTRDVVGKEYGEKYVPAKPRFYSSKAKNAQEAHEAIRPTDPGRLPIMVKKRLTEDQFRLYELIWKRLVASQMEPALLDKVAADIESEQGDLRLRANGSTMVFDGFMKLYNEGKDDGKDEDEDSILPALAEGDTPNLKDAEAEQHFTQPPPRYSEASLVKKLEELGIGRPSTYAAILSVLQDRGYVVLEKKRFVPEVRGRLVTSFLEEFFPKYVEYDFTAELENTLDEISGGRVEWKQALAAFWKDFRANVDEALELQLTHVLSLLNESLQHLLFPGEGDLKERRTCPACKKGELSLKLGKFGAFLGCSDYPECNYTKPLTGSASENEGESEDVAALTEPKLLGEDPKNGLDVTLRKGPYGLYVQLGEAEKGKKTKPKRASLGKGTNPADVTLEAALSLLALPREVGLHPETGKMIEASIGRFGPYVKHDGKFVSLKEGDDVLTIGVNRAVDVIASAASKARAAATPLKVLGKHPETEKEIGIYEGRYGPYVKHEKVNASLPKGVDPEQFTLEEALELLKNAKSKGKKKPAAKKKKPAAKKKAAPKKKAS